MTTFVGTVKAPPGKVLLADARLSVGKKTFTERRAVHAFTLETEDGQSLTVEGAIEAHKRGSIEREGKYGAIADETLMELFGKHAPGDHVRVGVRGFVLCGGDTVCVEGEITEFAASTEGGETGSLREAPKRVPRVGHAGTLSLGREPIAASPSPEAADAPAQPAKAKAPKLESRPPLHTSSRVYTALGLVMVFVAIEWGHFGPLDGWRNWLTPLFAMGLVFLSMGLGRWLRGGYFGPSVSVVGGARVTPHEAIWGYSIEVFLFVIGYGLCVFFPVLEARPSVVTSFVAVTGLVGVFHAIGVLLNERALRRFASLVLSAPRGVTGAGKMGLLEGRITGASGELLERETTYYLDTQTHQRVDKNGNYSETRTTTLRDRISTRGAEFVVEASGQKLRVLPQRAHVSFARRTLHPRGELPRYVERAVEGDPVCVVGRFQRSEDGTLRVESAGEESLFVFVGTRAELARAWLFSTLRVVALLGLGAVPVALSLTVFPFAVTWRAEGVVTESDVSNTPVGAPCTLRLLGYSYGESPRCTAALECNGQSLYGGFGMGQLECVLPPSPAVVRVSGADTDSADGDAALSFELGAKGGAADGVTWSDGAHSLRIRLERATQSWFF